MLFFVQSNVVEKGNGAKISDLNRDLLSGRVDAVAGSIVALAVAWFIIITTGTVLFPEGITVQSAQDAAMALEPLAGQYAKILFGVGLVAASFLACCVLPLTTSFVVCEAFGWEAGVNFKWREAPTFKSLITGIIVLSVLVVLLPDIGLMDIMLTSQFIGGLILPVLLIFMALIAGNRYIMGNFVIGKFAKFFLWLTIILVSALTIALIFLQ